jgi:DNA primase
VVNDFFSFVRNAVDIVDVVGRYVSLRPAGNYLKGLSPFQSEKTPSFTVSPGKKIFYCFSSNTGGDVIEFVARVENCNNFEAAMILINQYNIIVPKELIGQQKKNLEQRSFYFDTCLVFAQFCYENFYSHAFDDSLDYMKKRGFSDTIKIS